MTALTVDLPDDMIELIAQRVAAILQPAQPDPWIGVTDAAAHLGTRPQRIYDLVHDGRMIPGKDYARDGTRLRFQRSTLDRWLRAQP